jgi:outer membrane protein
VAELALRHYPTVAEASAALDAAEGVAIQARAARLPALFTDASLARYQEPSLVAPLHGFDPTSAPEFDRDLVRANLSFSYSIFDGGARGARIDVAESGAAMAALGEDAARKELLASVTAAYLDLLTNRDLLAAAESQREALEAEEERVRQFLAEGKAARVDLLRVQAALSRSTAAEISLSSYLDLAIGRLSRLTGIPREDLGEGRLARVGLAQRTRPTLENTLAVARDASPELRMAREQVVAADAGVRQARAAWMPTLEAGGAYSDFGSLGGTHQWEWQGSLRVSYPIFTGGARRGAQDQASAEARRASETLRKADLALEQEVERALSNLTETRALRQALELGVEQTQEVARIEGLALDVGSGVQTDYLRAQAELFRARASLAQARHGELLATVSLARISGELTLTWLQENMEVVR